MSDDAQTAAERLGEALYTAWQEHAGTTWQTYFPMRQWDRLRPESKAACIAIAQAVSAAQSERVAELERERNLLEANSAALIASTLREVVRLFERVSDLEAVIRKHYPSIAGSVIHYDKLGEKNAADEWNRVAQDFYRVLAPAATDGGASDG